jgi:hypothetical protein
MDKIAHSAVSRMFLSNHFAFVSKLLPNNLSAAFNYSSVVVCSLDQHANASFCTGQRGIAHNHYAKNTMPAPLLPKTCVQAMPLFPRNHPLQKCNSQYHQPLLYASLGQVPVAWEIRILNAF